VLARLRWRRPRRAGRLRDDLATWTLREAELLGVTGRGALSGPGRALAAGDLDAAATALAPLLPEPVDVVLLQADLTAVAPGPLTAELASELSLCADVESRGGATVYRFTESSVRRALDAGRSADELKTTLAAHSRKPVPQPLSYLVDDIARRHGRIRVGTASAYVRCDDDGLLTEIVADRRAATIGVRRLAATVLAAQSPVDVVLDRLREMGYAPVAENTNGEVVVRRPDARRTPPRQRPPRLASEPPVPSDTLLAAAVRAMRAGERAASAVGRGSGDQDGPPAPVPRATPAEALAALRDAAKTGSPVWIGYVNADGRATQRVIEPVSVAGGYVSAFDHLREEVRTFALHRITGVAAVESA
ncbi:MAG: helicase-associated domain-containing protein, partial [Actinomycetota bacterium]|nr:helicase-associated domain-containing protein [Actinomycetota bacterium]